MIKWTCVGIRYWLSAISKLNTGNEESRRSKTERESEGEVADGVLGTADEESEVVKVAV